MDTKLLDAYADLIVKTGANVQPGQYVVIRTNVELEPFASLVARKCYQHGAKRVFVHWQSAKMDQVDYQEASEEVLSDVPSFEEEAHKFMADHTPILIWIDGDDPDGLKGVDANKVARIKANKYKVIGKYREAQENKAQWCIAGAPTKAWAKKVFPDLPVEEAIEALWKAILKTSRAENGNGIEEWEKHEEDLKERCEKLNSFHLTSLHYRSDRGTDLTIGLIPGVIFLGGGEKTDDGKFFQPNIPSEECFTSPWKGKAEGIVYATKPLVYNGQVIKNFSVRFHNGKAIEVKAEEGEEVLKSILSLDEGASYLGECALVPFHSPINDTGILFYNTLYDENAACHLALGRGFTELYPNHEKYSLKELEKRGINSSLSHVDFMVGDDTLDITGTDDKGKEIPIFVHGAWAF